MPPPSAIATLGLPVIEGGDVGPLSAPPPQLGQVLSQGGSAVATGTATAFILGEGLPAVPARLVKKILDGEFIDMAELLHDNVEVERRRADQGGPTISEPRRPRREVPDIMSWLQCFGMFASVLTSRRPERCRELWAYQTTIVREARRCGGLGWRSYDARFRQLAASAEVDWSKVNTSIYAVTFIAQGNRGRMCRHCLEADHESDTCALAPRAAGSHLDRSTPQPVVVSTPPLRPPQGRRQVCFSWNEGRCSYPYCRFRHVCMRCQGEHRSWQCRTPPAAVGQPAPPPPVSQRLGPQPQR